MSEQLKEYDQEVNGFETTVLLSDADAEANELSGGRGVPDYEAPDITQPPGGNDEPEAEPQAKKATVSNKKSAASDK